MGHVPSPGGCKSVWYATCFYEANLALKAAEEGLKVDSVSPVDFPGREKSTDAATKKAAQKTKTNKRTDKKGDGKQTTGSKGAKK